MGEPQSQNVQTLELYGLECPHTFVRAKLVMETLESGNCLNVIVDNPLSKVDLPRSAELHGYTVVSVAEIRSGVYQITLKK